MKTSWLTIVLLVFAASRIQGQVSQSGPPAIAGQGTVPVLDTPYAVVDRGANHRVWQRTTYETTPDGRQIPQIHKYTELATGLHYFEKGQWIESKEEIDILPNGTAAAIQGQHQAYFPGNIYQGMIKLVTPDGKSFISRPLGLSYDDGTHTVLIAELKDSVGQLVGPNQVIFFDAFTDFKADLRYTYTKAGFEQDIILRESPLTPESFGLNPATARLQVLTEFFNPPQPAITTAMLPKQAGITLRDENLDFGVMKMMLGRAFLLGSDAHEGGALVSKSWVKLEGRQFLVEEVPVEALVDELAQLPVPQTASTKPNVNSMLHVASAKRLLPAPRLTKTSPSGQFKQVAQAATPTRGLVLDYQTLNTSQTDYTFQGDTTYFISGSVNLYGTNTLEGGAVIKYTNGTSARISINGPLNCNTSPYRPAIFTAKDDNTVGETISGSSGTPTGYYGNTGLYFGGNSSQALHDIRMSYLSYGVGVTYDYPDTIRDAQFINCQNAVGARYADSHLRNVLVWGGGYVFYGYPNVFCENVTFHRVTNLYSGSGLPVCFTNSLVVAVNTNGATISGVNNQFLSSDPGNIFRTVGAGSHYLATNSPYRNVGTTNIDATLLADLATKTTYPPIVYSNYTFSIATNFSPQAQRDTNALLDLGYHYDPLDYAFGGVRVYSNLTFTAGTAVGWFELPGSGGPGYGISIYDNVILSFNGTAASPCTLARYSTVQEGGNGLWKDKGWLAAIAAQSLSGGYGMNPTNAAQVRPNFTRHAALAGDPNHYREYNALIKVVGQNSEFWNGYVGCYWVYLNFTNCLFDRTGVGVYGSAWAICGMRNCTMHGGNLTLQKFGQTWPVWIEECAFDGTTLQVDDNSGGNTNITYCDFNAFLTNAARLPVYGTHDVTNLISYNWQSSWLGNYYLPTNSQLIDMGNTNANLLGLYHFTTQTNQVKETNSPVDIGYHYVAVDTNGNPLASYGDGIPDYLDDTDGNGLPDWWEIQYFDHIGIDPNADPDGDHLSNFQEYNLGTNPNNADTDGDGRTDWQEVMDGTDPLNSNSKATSIYKADAKMNTKSVTITTIPSLTIWVSNGIAYVALTNGMTNVLYDLYGKTNLLSSSWIWLGKLNIQGQYTNATSVYQQFYWTIGGPLDSDGDGLTDDYEYYVTHTDWNNPDSDYDGRSDGQEILLDGTDPNNGNSVTNVMLAYWRFNNTNTWVGEEGQLPILATNIVGVPSWGTNAVWIGTNTTAILKYHDVEPTNYAPANINCRNGTVQFWFAPDWNSGTGPGSAGRLIEMGSQTSTTGWWSLYFNTNGTQLIFGTQTNGLALTNLTATINWASNYWHQIVLTYSLTNSSLYVDGQSVATNGLGANYYPNRNERANGFYIGSDVSGTNQARGVFDELDTFNYPLDATSIATNYQTMYQMDRDGGGLSAIWEMDYFGHLGVNPNADPDGDGWSNWQEYLNGTNPTNADQPFLILITQPWAGSIIP